MTEMIAYLKCKWQKGIFAMSPWCDTSGQSAQLWNSQSPECGITSPRNWDSTDINISVSSMCLECPYERLARQVQLVKPTEKWFRGHPSLGVVNTVQLRPLLVSSWCGASRTFWNAVDLEVFRVLLGLLLPRPSLKEKRAWKWMEWITFTLFSWFTGV